MTSTNMVIRSSTTNHGLQLKDSEDLGTLRKTQDLLALLILLTAWTKRLMDAREIPLLPTWPRFQTPETNGNAIRTLAADATCQVRPKLPTQVTSGSVTKTQVVEGT